MSLASRRIGRLAALIAIVALLGLSAACKKKSDAPSEAMPPSAESEGVAPDPRLEKLAEEMFEYRKRVDENPKDVEALSALGNANLALGRADHAKEWYERALEVEPDRLSTRVDLAIALRYMGRPDEAIAQLRRVLDEAPRDAMALYNLGVILLEDKQDHAGAIAQWEAMMAAHPDDPRVPQLKEVVAGLKDPSAAPGATTPPGG